MANNAGNNSNVITIWGNIGKVKELNFTPSGKAVLNFSVAVTTKKDDQEVTTWYDCAAWENEATHWDGRIAKGMRCAVMGPVKPEEYTKQDGTKGTSLKMSAWKLIVDDIKSRESEEGSDDEYASNASVGQTSGYSASSREIYDEIPF